MHFAVVEGWVELWGEELARYGWGVGFVTVDWEVLGVVHAAWQGVGVPGPGVSVTLRPFCLLGHLPGRTICGPHRAQGFARRGRPGSGSRLSGARSGRVGVQEWSAAPDCCCVCMTPPTPIRSLDGMWVARLCGYGYWGGGRSLMDGCVGGGGLGNMMVVALVK